MESYFIGVEVKTCRVEEQSNRDPGSTFSLKTSYFPSKGVNVLEMKVEVDIEQIWSSWSVLMQLYSCLSNRRLWNFRDEEEEDIKGTK